MVFNRGFRHCITKNATNTAIKRTANNEKYVTESSPTIWPTLSVSDFRGSNIVSTMKAPSVQSTGTLLVWFANPSLQRNVLMIMYVQNLFEARLLSKLNNYSDKP